MHARPLGWSTLAVLLSTAGCLDGDAGDCQPLRGLGVVQAVSGRDVHVLLDDGEPAVLHLPAAVFVLEGEACVMTGPAGVRVGDHITFEVDAWAESYPMQGWPETAVILRG